MKIAVLGDIHFSPSLSSACGREYALSDIFLLRAVKRINRYIKPDLVLVTGDIVNLPSDTASLETCAGCISMLDAPKLVVPGNHDPAPETFYKYFDPLPEKLDIGRYRILPFIDTEMPDFNAVRSGSDIARMKALTEEFDGRVISFQHLPLFRKGASPSPYSILNAGSCPLEKTFLSIGGHFHDGFADIVKGSFSSICVPALCESPFRYGIIDIDDATGEITYSIEQLRLPVSGITDYHVHTSNAYCQENMDPERTFEFVRAFGLERFAFTEHSGQLYASATDYWSGNFQRCGFDSTPMADRTKNYFSFLDSVRGKFNFIRGFELDSAADGSLLVLERDLEKVDFRLGAVHWVTPDPIDIQTFEDDFLFRCEKLMQNGVHALAHPFRIFLRKGLTPSPSLYAPLAKMLKKYSCAAEINFHSNEPDAEFFAVCHENGVKISLGSDSHNLFEIGEFYANLKMLDAIGVKPSELYFFECNLIP